MPNPLFLWLKLLFGKWTKLMCSLAGLVLSILGWFLIPDVSKLRPFVVGMGVLCLLASSYLAWLSEHKKLTKATKKLAKANKALDKALDDKQPKLQGVIEDFDIRPNSSADNWFQIVTEISFHNVHPTPALIRGYHLALSFPDKTYGALTIYYNDLCIELSPNGSYKAINLASRVGSTVSQDDVLEGYLVFSVGGIPRDLKPDKITVRVDVGYEGAEFVLEYCPTRNGGANRVYFCGEPLPN